MLSYKKKASTDTENVVKNQKKDDKSFNINDISKVENEQTPREGITNVPGVNSGEGKQVHALDITAKEDLSKPVATSGLQQDLRQYVDVKDDLPYTMKNQFRNSFVQQNPVVPPNYVINIQQNVDTESIIVETLHQQKRFIFYDRNKNFLGGFSILEFIKYVTSNVSLEFLPGIDGDSVRNIVERYICSVTRIDTPSKRYIINMLSYLDSPFMGNIETLIKFYTFIHDFETNMLENELAKLPQPVANQVRDIFNNMIYTLLNHILKIIAILTNKLDTSDPNSSQIKNTLLNYSVAIVYRLSKFIREEINKKMDELSVLNQDMLRIEGVRTTISSKIENVQRSIDKQNAEIDVVLRNIIQCQMIQQNHVDRNDQNIQRSDVKIDQSRTEAVVKKQSPVVSSELSHVSTSDMPTSSSSSIVSSSLDRSHIYGLTSDANLHSDSVAISKSNRSRDLRASELLEDLKKIRSASEKQHAGKNTTVDKFRQNDTNSTRSDNTAVKSASDRNLHRSKHTNRSDNRLPTDSVKSLTDIINVHTKIDFSSDKNETKNSFDVVGNNTIPNSKFMSPVNAPRSSVLQDF